MAVNQRVREIRGLLSTKDFDEILEVSPQLISSIESDTKNLSIKLVSKISVIY